MAASQTLHQTTMETGQVRKHTPTNMEIMFWVAVLVWTPPYSFFDLAFT